MNTIRSVLLLAWIGLTLAFSAHAQVVQQTLVVNELIPDGNLSGLASSVTINSAATSLADLSVSLSLSPGQDGGFTGDLYALLVHGSESIVLLNRPGRDTDRRSGYGDGVEIHITFSNAGVDDPHLYREVISGNSSQALSGPLTGVWQPDGRDTSPLTVVTLSARNPSMHTFDPISPDGQWTLFVADLSNGGRYQLDSWTLEFTGLSSVPEPASSVIVTAFTVVCVRLWLRCRPG